MERDPAMDRWRDQAATAAGAIGESKFDKIEGILDAAEAGDLTLADVQAHLRMEPGSIASDDEEDLNRQVLMAGLLRGRFAVADAAGKLRIEN